MLPGVAPIVVSQPPQRLEQLRLRLGGHHVVVWGWHRRRPATPDRAPPRAVRGLRVDRPTGVDCALRWRRCAGPTAGTARRHETAGARRRP